MADDEPDVGSLVNLQGWGKTGNFGGASNTLQKAEGVPVISDEEAIRAVGVDAAWDQFFCTNSRENGICGGDSGGPITQVSDSDDELRLVGIVSFGAGLCENGPGCYTSIKFARDWLGK
jgi:secreted trypsin-like serine protease